MVDQTDPTCWSNIIQHCWMEHVESVRTSCWVMMVDQTDPTCWFNIIQHCWMQHVGSVWTLCWMIVLNQTDPTCWYNINQHCWMQNVESRLNTLLDDGTRSNGSNMLVQHHPTLLDAACWIRLNTLLDDDSRYWTSLVGYIFPSNICPTCSTNNVRT